MDKNGAPIGGAKGKGAKMSINRVRVIVIGLLTLLAVGSLGASAAYAEAGPFWHHRNGGEEGKGMKIDQKTPENFNGEGGEQILIGIISGTPIEMSAQSVQAKGIIYNTTLQGQVKLLQKYHELRLTKPELKPCEVKLGTNNELKIEIHLAWKWNGEAKQLKENPQNNQKPSGIGTSEEIVKGAEKLPEGSITTITLSGTGCGVLAGTFKVNNSISAIPEPSNLEEWSRKAVLLFPGWKKLHFWNGAKFVGVEPGLTFAGNSASYIGSTAVEAAIQEIAVFEK